MRILIAEDHFLVAEALRLLLAEAGHEVVGVASDASEAVRLCGEHRPDMAFVDVRLAHGSSGIEAARLMKADYGTPSLLATGNPDLGEGAREAALGWLRKPYSDHDLLAALRVAEALARGEPPPPVEEAGFELFTDGLAGRA